MPVTLSFAHLSDPHLPLPGQPLSWRLLTAKRVLGHRAWHGRRRHHHRAEVLAALVADVAAARPDHLLVTGDLVNIALPAEFEAARAWLETLGRPEEVTVVPGNHDRYVAMPVADGTEHWRPWMQDDTGADGFPFVRRRGPVAFVCLSTAVPTAPLLASGRLGADQIARAEALLADLGRERLFRVLTLHHPPEDRPTGRRKGLSDRRALQRAVARTGAELVLHGHQHDSRFGRLEGPRGPVPVLGVPSASAAEDARKGEPARWHLLRVEREDGGWHLSCTARGLTTRGFATLGRWRLSISS